MISLVMYGKDSVTEKMKTLSSLQTQVFQRRNFLSFYADNHGVLQLLRSVCLWRPKLAIACGLIQYASDIDTLYVGN